LRIKATGGFEISFGLNVEISIYLQEVCVAVAVALHYVFLAAFMWMAVEGHHLYRLVVRVFDSGRDLSRIYLAVGYGSPVALVAITCTVTAALQDSGYANDELSVHKFQY